MNVIDPVTVICVKWGTKYGFDYVIKLRNMVQRNLTLPHRFVCLTDDGAELTDIDCQELPSGFTGWWNKISIFKKDMFKDDSVILFFDLDIVITDRIDFLLESPGDFCICDSFSNKATYNSSIMRFRANRWQHVYDDFVAQRETERVRRLHGDQDWLWLMVPGAQLWPRSKIVSFKLDLIPNAERAGMFPRVDLMGSESIVTFHGKPNPGDLVDASSRRFGYAPFVRDHWR